MLNTFVEAQEEYNTFFRPAVYDSLRAVLKFYGLESSAQIYYNGEAEIAKMVGVNTTDNLKANRYTDGIYRNKIYIVPEVEPHEFNSGFSNQRRMETELPTWSDGGVLPLSFTPSFEGRRVRVAVIAHFTGRQEAKQFVNRINRLQANQAVAFNFSANVHMVINPEIIEFYKVIHAMLARNNPDTPDLPTWFDEGCKAPIDTVSNAAGNLKRMVALAKLDNIGIYFEEPQIKLSQKSQQFGRYEVELAYSFYFQEFLGWELQYPLTVYQEEIPAKYIPVPQEKHVERFNRRVAPEVEFAKSFGFPDRSVQAPYYLKLPAHDPWAWKRQAWLQPILQARLALKAVDSQVLCNIFDIPGFEWNMGVKEYMLRRHKFATTHNEAPFLIQVFSNDQRVSAQRLSMDATGVVTLTGEPLLTNTYRIIVVLNWAIRDYSDAFWEDMRKNPTSRPIMESIFPNYDWNQFPGPWVDYLDEVRRDIAKGYGKFPDRINTYMMNLDLHAYYLIKETGHESVY